MIGVAEGLPGRHLLHHLLLWWCRPGPELEPGSNGVAEQWVPTYARSAVLRGDIAGSEKLTGSCLWSASALPSLLSIALRPAPQRIKEERQQVCTQ